MSHSHEEFLLLFGWNQFFETNLTSESLYPARVIGEEKNLYRVQLGVDRSVWASVAGKLQFNAITRADLPAVGDWVLIETSQQSDRAIIHHVCPRKSILQRKQVGSSSDIQILSTNVDYMFVTTSVNDELNFRRIERYLTVAWESGAVPVILLTKVDTIPEKISEVVKNVQNEFSGVAVHTLSKDHFEVADFFSHYLQKGRTSVVVGSSGVGKSTLVNYLIGREKIKTQNIRESDAKGRHTTTSRSMYITKFGGLIIDTPGMRELQLSDHEDGVSTQFNDIEELMTKCHFSNCQHDTEPNCAVKDALSNESLSQERWGSYQKLAAEVRFEMRKRDKALASEERKVWKKLGKAAKERSKMKRR